MRSRLVCALVALGLSIAGPISAGENAPTYAEHLDLSYTLDAKGAKHPIRTPRDWETRRKHILANMQTVMGPLPQPSEKVPLDVKVLAEADLGDFVRKKITYHTDSAERAVNAYLFVPKGASKTTQTAGILCLQQTIQIGKDEPAGLGGKPSLHYALDLAKRGYVTLAPDYPSFGEYEYDFAPDKGYISGSMKAIYDNTRAIDLLQSLPEVAPERIGCIGHSLGGHNTMFTAAFDTRIKALVSSCGFTRFHKYYEGNLQGWTSDRYMPLIKTRYGNDPNRVPFDFTEIVASFAPRAFLASAPLHDANFENSGVRDVIAAAQPIYALYGASEALEALYPDCEHDFPPESRATAWAFFEKHLGPGVGAAK